MATVGVKGLISGHLGLPYMGLPEPHLTLGSGHLHCALVLYIPQHWHARIGTRVTDNHEWWHVFLDFTDYTPPPANFDAAVGKPLVLSCARKPSVKG